MPFDSLPSCGQAIGSGKSTCHALPPVRDACQGWLLHLYEVTTSACTNVSSWAQMMRQRSMHMYNLSFTLKAKQKSIAEQKLSKSAASEFARSLPCHHASDAAMHESGNTRALPLLHTCVCFARQITRQLAGVQKRAANAPHKGLRAALLCARHDMDTADSSLSY